MDWKRHWRNSQWFAIQHSDSSNYDLYPLVIPIEVQLLQQYITNMVIELDFFNGRPPRCCHIQYNL